MTPFRAEGSCTIAVRRSTVVHSESEAWSRPDASSFPVDWRMSYTPSSRC